MGGHAFPDSVPVAGTARADQVVDALRGATGWHLEPVGSYGHKAEMSDLDLIVPADQFDRARLAQLGQTMPYNLGGAGLRYVHDDGAVHQVDFFPVLDMRWGKWARTGASDSGKERILLLNAAAATYEEPGMDMTLWDGDVEVARASRTLDQRVGLRRIFQHRLRRRGGGLLASPKTTDAAEFELLFGFRAPPVPTYSDPREVKAMVLGGPDVDDSSAASLWAHVVRTFPAERLRRIRIKVAERRRGGRPATRTGTRRPRGGGGLTTSRVRA